MALVKRQLYYKVCAQIWSFLEVAFVIKLLFVGCTEVGKTLIVKQLLFFEKGIEESDDATTIISNPCWRDEIRREMIDAIQVLAVETEKKNLSIDEPYTLLGKDHNIRTLRTDILDSTVNPNIFFETCYYLWNDPSVKEIVQKKNQNQICVPIPRNVSYYFKDRETIEKISQFSYAPSVLDYIQCYEESQAVNVTETTIHSHKYKFIDSCGKERYLLDRAMEKLLSFHSHHKPRKSSSPQSFEMNPDYLSITSINTQFWFVASLVSYDEKSVEDESKSQLKESLEAWETCLSIWLEDTQRPVILVLTMYDLLREKWSKGSRFDSETLASQVLGVDHCDSSMKNHVFFYDDAVDFIAKLYLKKLELLCQQWKEERFIRICVIDTVDRRTVAKLFTEVAEKFNFSSEMIHLDNHIINFVKMANRDSMKSHNAASLPPSIEEEEDAEKEEEEEQAVVIETTDQNSLFDAFQDQGLDYPKPIFQDTYDPILAAKMRAEIKTKQNQAVRPPVPHIKSRSSGTYATPPLPPSRTVSVPILPLKDLQREPTSPPLLKAHSDVIFVTSPINSPNSNTTQQESLQSGRRRSIFSQFKNLVKKAKDSSSKPKHSPPPPPPPSKNIKPKLIQGQDSPSSPKQEEALKDAADFIKKQYTFVASSDSTASLCSSIQIKMTYELSLCNIVFKLDDGSTWKYDKNTNQSVMLSPHSSTTHNIGAIATIAPSNSPSFMISTPRDWSKETNLKLIVQMDSLGKLSKVKLVHNTGSNDEENFVFRMKRHGLDILDDWLLQRRRRGIDEPVTLEEFLSIEDVSDRFSTICSLKNYELTAK